MKVAVIDDESIFRMQLRMMVEKIAVSRELPLNVEEFSSGQAFLEASRDTHFDIVFLDIFMPEMDGIETAKKFRKHSEKSFLIFMTASEGHYPDAFSVHAFDYVTKPFTIERIDTLITEIVSHTPIDSTFIKISVGSVEERIYLKNIVSVTTDAHYVEIHKEDGETSRARLTSGEFLDLTGSDSRFLIINRGIIINMDYIDRLVGGDVYMDDRTVFPISAKKVSDITQKIRDYQFTHK
jgi:DNA-binding LytR/AlgR family response regulator